MFYSYPTCRSYSINFVIEVPYKHSFLMLQQIEMNFKKIDVIRGIRNYEFSPPPEVVSIICPSCQVEVTTREIIERGGRVGCINCIK